MMNKIAVKFEAGIFSGNKLKKLKKVNPNNPKTNPNI